MECLSSVCAFLYVFSDVCVLLQNKQGLCRKASFGRWVLFPRTFLFYTSGIVLRKLGHRLRNSDELYVQVEALGFVFVGLLKVLEG